MKEIKLNEIECLILSFILMVMGVKILLDMRVLVRKEKEDEKKR